MDIDETVTIPADVDREDRVVAGLTARQLAILVPAGVLVWLAYLTVGPLLSFAIFAAIAVPFLAAAAALALVEHDGVALYRLAWHAIIHATDPRRLVAASADGVPALPGWVRPRQECLPLPAPLRLPARAIGADGVIDLGTDGVAVVVACSTISFALRTPEEQAGLVEALGVWLNSLSGPAQILVQAQPINLTPTITALRQRAPALPHPALETAAVEHARFLSALAATRDLFARRVLIVLREPPATAAGGQQANAAAVRVVRRGEQSVRALAAAGITAHLLDGRDAHAALAAAADPWAPPIDRHGQAAAQEAITGRHPETEAGR